MTNPAPDLALTTALIPVVLAAGRAAMAVRTRGAAVMEKDDKSPVTEADQRAEAMLIAAIKAEVPDWAIVAEEAAAAGDLPEALTEFFWLIDPLDGTKEFIKGGTDFTVNVGLIQKDMPVLGLVYAPARGRLFYGAVGHGAFEVSIDGLRVSEPKPLGVAAADQSKLKVVASKSHRDEQTDQYLATKHVGNLVSAGSSLKFCLIATGEADLYPRFGPTCEWDTAAGHAVVSAAGGRVTKTDGSAFAYAKQADKFLNPGFIVFGDPATPL
ncbi:MAG: 3'(2'),5'-bisphosphate nucleotidase CysQ [Pseudomonadota bacterium]